MPTMWTFRMSPADEQQLQRAQLWRSNCASNDGLGFSKMKKFSKLLRGQTACLFPLSSHYLIYNLLSVNVAERNSNGVRDKDKTINLGNEKFFFMLTDSNHYKLTCHIFLHIHLFTSPQAYFI